MFDGTHALAASQPTRPEWRDAIKADRTLTSKDVLVGLLIADFWKTDSNEPLWAVIDVLIRQSRLSRSAVFEALRNLRDAGYLFQVEAARHGRSPRWLPLLPTAEQSTSWTNQSSTATNQSRTTTRDLTDSSRSPKVGSDDLDCESHPFFSEKPTNKKERADFQLLADHMTNYGTEGVALVYKWLREGRDSKPMCYPGGFAQKKHAKPTRQDGMTEWQGYFLRCYMQGQDNAPAPRVKAADPWAA